ncbi:glycerate kinase family protein [Pseudomonas sp. OV226]|nr:glycerate kinase family protein [Pseudomonas sp. OV226]
MGFAALAFLRAEFRPGVDVVAELVGLSEKVKGADLVITGEGRCDAQTLRGETPISVARIAREHGAPAVIPPGTLGEGYEGLYEHGIDAAFALASGPMSLADACSQAPRL